MLWHLQIISDMQNFPKSLWIQHILRATVRATCYMSNKIKLWDSFTRELQSRWLTIICVFSPIWLYNFGITSYIRLKYNFHIARQYLQRVCIKLFRHINVKKIALRNAPKYYPFLKRHATAIIGSYFNRNGTLF